MWSAICGTRWRDGPVPGAGLGRNQLPGSGHWHPGSQPQSTIPASLNHNSASLSHSTHLTISTISPTWLFRHIKPNLTISA